MKEQIIGCGWALGGLIILSVVLVHIIGWSDFGWLLLGGFGPPTVPCTECTKMIIQSGILRVVGRPFVAARPDWLKDLEFSAALLKEAGVKFDDFGT